MAALGVQVVFRETMMVALAALATLLLLPLAHALQAAEAEAASAGAAHIDCDARADTAAAYYEKRGYTAAGPPFAKYADSEQLYATMRKPLA